MTNPAEKWHPMTERNFDIVHTDVAVTTWLSLDVGVGWVEQGLSPYV
jgi:hypothetical protein